MYIVFFKEQIPKRFKPIKLFSYANIIENVIDIVIIYA